MTRSENRGPDHACLDSERGRRKGRTTHTEEETDEYRLA
jgi:hypothetical protein